MPRGAGYGVRLCYSPAEAAELLGVSEGLIRKRIACGELPASRMGTRWLIPRAAIEAYGRLVQPIPAEAAQVGRPIGRRTG